MISAQQNADCLAKLGMLKFFPSRESTVAEIGRLLNDLCDNDHEARELTTAVLESLSEWPGPSKVREIYRAEVAPHRPQKAEPKGCDLCRGMDGWRRVFTIFTRTHGGPDRKQTFRPDSNPDEFGRELRAQYAKSPNHTLYEEIAPCKCAAGRVRQEQCRQADSRERGQ